MKLTVDIIKVVQALLNTHFNSKLVVDGIAGASTMAAVVKAVPQQIKTLSSEDKQMTGLIQHIAATEGIDAGRIDGLWGPQTQYAFEQLSYKLQHGVLPAPWRDEDVISYKWPLQNEESMIAFYGNPGENQTNATSPYPLKVAWDTTDIITEFSCNVRVKDSIERVLAKVLSHYGIERIQALGLDLWGGCLSVRKMRGGTKWSNHAFGSAIDWDPARNQLKWGKDRANFAKPEYDKFFEFWEEEGWVSLGRTKGYDYMHIGAVRLK